MAGVYIVGENGQTQEMKRMRCESESRELQDVLENNHDLLPGDQINPENPRRWLLIKREMPVPDPNTGLVRWSIDFLFADQDAVPTFVECKRFADTRSRREVVGQMIEYAANGHHYWDKQTLRDFAEKSAKKPFEELLAGLHPDSGDSVDAFFERLQQNLREGQLRLVFFLEESPIELRSVVDFLNKQMERSEVLLVEARQYHLNGSRVIVPTLFGYTEEARQVKRTVTVTTAATRRTWDEMSFFSRASESLQPQHVNAMKAIFDQSVKLKCNVTWGTGAVDGTFNVQEPSICQRSFMTVFSNGRISLNFGWLNGSDVAERARGRLKELTLIKTGLLVPEDYERKWVGFSSLQWSPNVAQLTDVLTTLVTEFRTEAEAGSTP